jgi:hypothetical protein
MKITDVLARAIFPDRSPNEVQVCAVVDRVLTRLDNAGFEVRRKAPKLVVPAPANDNRPPPPRGQRRPQPPLASGSPPVIRVDASGRNPGANPTLDRERGG